MGLVRLQISMTSVIKASFYLRMSIRDDAKIISICSIKILGMPRTNPRSPCSHSRQWKRQVDNPCYYHMLPLLSTASLYIFHKGVLH